jgi:hypothetical protein
LRKDKPLKANFRELRTREVHAGVKVCIGPVQTGQGRRRGGRSQDQGANEDGPTPPPKSARPSRSCSVAEDPGPVYAHFGPSSGRVASATAFRYSVRWGGHEEARHPRRGVIRDAGPGRYSTTRRGGRAPRGIIGFLCTRLQASVGVLHKNCGRAGPGRFWPYRTVAMHNGQCRLRRTPLGPSSENYSSTHSGE